MAKIVSLHQKLHKVPRDGNCLFHAVADNMRYHPVNLMMVDHKILKQTMCLYLKNHKEELEVN